MTPKLPRRQTARDRARLELEAKTFELEPVPGRRDDLAEGAVDAVGGASRHAVSQMSLGMSPRELAEDPHDAAEPARPGAEAPELAELAVDAPLPLWRQMLRVYVANRLAVISTVVLVLIVLACYLGPLLYHTNQTNAELALSQPENLPPSAHHIFGTDNYGWDELGRVMYGGEYSLALGALAGFITIVIGTLYGMVSGFFGGITDGIMMRVLDACLAIPYLFLLIALISVFHDTTSFLILVIGLTGWWGNARIIRSDALVIRDLEYSQASVSMGARRLHIIRRHIFPNSVSNIVTVGTFSVADAILFLSALGFLGFGIQPPATDWGTMMNSGTALLIDGYWWETYPVAIVFVTVILCINYMGDAMRDIFEVRLRER